jgi:hypothetical protein
MFLQTTSKTPSKYSPKRARCLRTGYIDFGRVRYLDAADNFQQGLSLVERKQDQDLWAELQNAVGISLLEAGVLANDIPTVKRAIRTFSDSLEVRSKDRSLLLWAMTRVNWTMHAVGSANAASWWSKGRQLVWPSMPFKRSNMNGADDGI